jgi:cellulose synthase/poly-beta-1,6-N-acetylglucosamine synthase-like glycosyltransferase
MRAAPSRASEPFRLAAPPPPRHQVSRNSFERLLIDLGLIAPDRVAPLIRRARYQGVPFIRLVLANAIVREPELYGALATYHDLPFLARASRNFRPCIKASEIASCLAHGWIRLKARDGRQIIAAAPANASTTTMRHLAASHGRTEPFDAITTPGAIRGWIERHHGTLLLEDAIRSLGDASPELSAERRLARDQALLLGAVVVAVVALALLAPPMLVAGLLFGAVSLLFLGVALQRTITFVSEIGARPPRPLDPRVPDRELPVYTVLVPLYREAHMVREIVAAVLDLDYPRAKLDIKLILEADDEETRKAAHALDLPGCIDLVIVPTAFPRTKPKALNYALTFARGEFVTVYDAEDLPEPDQLRMALAVFAASDARLACVQARLRIRNAAAGWLSRHFAIEYAGLYDVIIPSFARLGQPIMLGGTSNHFRMEILRGVGGWDPFNVTEDADIGVRLYRRGFRAEWLDSTTLEEAPATLRNWFCQRTRWMRGWIQTYFVHMREPVKLARELGAARFAWLQLMLAGIVVSALVHPVFVAHLTWAALAGTAYIPGYSPVYDTLLLISAVNLLVGYGAVMEISVLGLYRARRADLLGQILFVPVYWLLISCAAYVALLRFAIAPFRWEKTHHHGLGEAPRTTTSRRSAPT